jgi:hypothetical protein
MCQSEEKVSEKLSKSERKKLQKLKIKKLKVPTVSESLAAGTVTEEDLYHH